MLPPMGLSRAPEDVPALPLAGPGAGAVLGVAFRSAAVRPAATRAPQPDMYQEEEAAAAAGGASPLGAAMGQAGELQARARLIAPAPAPAPRRGNPAVAR